MFVARELPVDAAARAGQGIDVRVFSEARAASREEILQEARGAAALVTTLSQRVDGDLLDALPTLRVVSNYAVGYDNIDVPACTVAFSSRVFRCLGTGTSEASMSWPPRACTPGAAR